VEQDSLREDAGEFVQELKGLSWEMEYRGRMMGLLASEARA
jgi:hypothetical protein